MRAQLLTRALFAARWRTGFAAGGCCATHGSRRTGVATRTVEDMDLWLSALDGFCRMVVTGKAIENGLVKPIYPWGSMAVASADSFAYLLQRPAGSDEDGKTLIELGACGYGPSGRELASA